MKHVLALGCLMLLPGCATRDARLETPPLSNRIGTNQLIEAFITYVSKAEGTVLDNEQRREMRSELQLARDDPLLAPYVFKGKRFDRKAIMDEIARAKAKWLASDIPPSKVAQYAFDPANLKTLSDAELVIAMRLVSQVTSKVEQIALDAAADRFTNQNWARAVCVGIPNTISGFTVSRHHDGTRTDLKSESNVYVTYEEYTPDPKGRSFRNTGELAELDSPSGAVFKFQSPVAPDSEHSIDLVGFAGDRMFRIHAWQLPDATENELDVALEVAEIAVDTMRQE